MRPRTSGIGLASYAVAEENIILRRAMEPEPEEELVQTLAAIAAEHTTTGFNFRRKLINFLERSKPPGHDGHGDATLCVIGKGRRSRVYQMNETTAFKVSCRIRRSDFEFQSHKRVEIAFNRYRRTMADLHDKVMSGANETQQLTSSYATSLTLTGQRVSYGGRRDHPGFPLRGRSPGAHMLRNAQHLAGVCPMVPHVQGYQSSLFASPSHRWLLLDDDLYWWLPHAGIAMNRIYSLPDHVRAAFVRDNIYRDLQLATLHHNENMDFYIQPLLAEDWNDDVAEENACCMCLRDRKVYLPQLINMFGPDVVRSLAIQMGTCLALIHWAAGLDANGVKFRIGCDDKGELRLWMMSFGSVKNLSLAKDSVAHDMAWQVAEKGYVPRVMGREGGNGRYLCLFDSFAQAYKSMSSRVIERDEKWRRPHAEVLWRTRDDFLHKLRSMLSSRSQYPP